MLRSRQTAMTTLSFALVAPLLLMLLFGIMEMGRVMSAWMVITSEATEAARFGAVRYDRSRDPLAQAADVRGFITSRLNGVLAPAGLSPAPDVKVTSTPTVDVTITYKVPLVIPLISNLVPNPFPLSARAVMRAETEG
jgi:Flp pilus assembly protein TadG